jgi:hypothetical protein
MLCSIKLCINRYDLAIFSLISLFWLIVHSAYVPCSWELASVLRDTKEKFDSAGVKLIAVGVGSPDKARILAERVCIILHFVSHL